MGKSSNINSYVTLAKNKTVHSFMDNTRILLASINYKGGLLNLIRLQSFQRKRFLPSDMNITKNQEILTVNMNITKKIDSASVQVK